MSNDPSGEDKPAELAAEKSSSMLPYLAISMFPAVILFLFIPIAIYLPNQEDFLYDIYVLSPFIILLGVSSACLILLSKYKSVFFRKLSFILFYIGLFVFLADIFAPLDIGEMVVGLTAVPIPEPIHYLFIEIAALFQVMILYFKIPESWVIKVLPKFIVSVVVVQLVFFVLNMHRSEINKEIVHSSDYIPVSENHKSNIYHITLDAFSGETFLDVINKANSEETFCGFTFFKENKSNYLFTSISRASYMSGTLFKNNPLEPWYLDWKKNGIIGTLAGAGYVVTDYSSSGSEHIDHLRSEKENHGVGAIRYVRLADLWFLRIVPAFLRNDVFDSQKNRGVASSFLRSYFITNNLDTLPVRHYKVLRTLIEDEKNRPADGQYVWAHIYLPHAPYNLNSNCEYQADSGYEEQATCAVKSMVDFIDKLKEQKKYHKSMIIIQSDHGSNPIIDHNMDKSVSDSINTTSFSGRSAQSVIDFASSVLFIKPPGSSCTPISVSSRPTQLADIAETIYQLNSIPADKTDGVNVLGDELQQDRTIDIFSGFVQITKDGKYLRYGKEITSGQFDHYLYNVDRGWSIGKPVEVVW
jgi:hypothetical protein